MHPQSSAASCITALKAEATGITPTHEVTASTLRTLPYENLSPLVASGADSRRQNQSV